MLEPPKRATACHDSRYIYVLVIPGAGCPRSPACGYAAGCSQDREAPKEQSAAEAVWRRDTDQGPHSTPSEQEPPTSAYVVAALLNHNPSH